MIETSPSSTRPKKIELRDYSCNQCDFVTTSSKNLKRHRCRFSQKRFPCDTCVYVATNADTLRKHIKSKHEGVIYSCNTCDKTFSKGT